MLSATIFDIQRNSYVDGPGIRTTVFFKGCNLRCAWCHNPESQSLEPQMLFYDNNCIGCGKCRQVCPSAMQACALCGKCELFCPMDARKICGKEYTTDEVLAEVLKDYSFYENSGGGVTFSGGECMLQIQFLSEMLKQCKTMDIHTAVDTAGNVPWEYFEEILPNTDLFLYDVKCFDSNLHQKYTGVDNRLILSNLKTLLQQDKNVWIRVPIITGVNDNIDEMKKIKDYINSFGMPERVELLPYHATGKNKYRAIGRTPQQFSPPTKEKLALLWEVFV